MVPALNARPQPRPAPRACRLGFLGLGWIGRTRLDALAASGRIELGGVEIAALADLNPQCRESAARRFPQATTAEDLEQLLACDLDGVVIATPSGQHAHQAIAALERGCAVFCQKPLAVTAKDAAAVVETAARVDRLLAVDYCYRYVQGMHELRRRVREGELGRIVAVDLAFHNAYAPDKSWCRDRHRAGGGCLLDLGVHLVDLALWLQDFPALEFVGSHLFREGRRYRLDDRDTEDFAAAELRQSNDALVRLACSWHAHTGRDAVIELALHGTRGGAAWRNVNGSFYDFQVEVFHGSHREVLGAPPDDWGPRALADWVARIAQVDGQADGQVDGQVDGQRDGQGERFDPAARGFVRGAEIIDAIYGREPAAQEVPQ